MGRTTSQRGLNPWTTVLATFGFASVFLLAVNLTLGGIVPGAAAHPADLLWLGRAWAGWLVLFLLAAGPTLAGFGLYNVSLSYLPSSVANLVVSVEPVLTAATAYVLFGERLDATQLTGSAMILPQSMPIVNAVVRNSSARTRRRSRRLARRRPRS